jgi:hypothetical protein
MKQKPILTHFLCSGQAACIHSAMRGEEGQWFRAKIAEMQALIDSMPVTYETENTPPAEKLARMHYFAGGADVWLIELDKGNPNDTDEDYQRQAFGVVDLGYGPELGYVCLPEILAAGLELDLHFTPRALPDLLPWMKEKQGASMAGLLK